MNCKNETEAFKAISKHCNYMGTNLAEVGVMLANDHPTLQQNFMRIVIGFIEEQAAKDYSDLRNEATVEQCKKFKETYSADGLYLPYV
jgi:hypothetical protein